VSAPTRAAAARDVVSHRESVPAFSRADDGMRAHAPAYTLYAAALVIGRGVSTSEPVVVPSGLPDNQIKVAVVSVTPAGA